MSAIAPGIPLGGVSCFPIRRWGISRRADPATYERIVESFVHWDDIDVHYRGRVIRAGGQGFAGIARRRLLTILQERASALGVELRFEVEAHEADFGDADVIVVADGAGSATRRAHAEAFGTTLEERRNRYIWLGTHQRFDAFTFAFEETPFGWFQVHAYQFDADTGTVIVECREETWRAAGLDTATTEESVAFCERLFARYLGGQRLMSNAAHLANPWISFVQVKQRALVRRQARADRGCGAHRAFFDRVGGRSSRSRMRLRWRRRCSDVILSLSKGRSSRVRSRSMRRSGGLRCCGCRTRRATARSGSRTSRATPVWSPSSFAYSLLTRSQRLTHDNLRLRDEEYIANIEAWLSQRAGTAGRSRRCSRRFGCAELELANRVVVFAMAMYSCVDGMPNDFYLVHLGARAQGGAGLVFTEMTCVAPDARISPGLRGDVSPRACRRLGSHRSTSVHHYTRAKIALQLGHAGPKGSTQRGWEEPDEPLEAGNWALLAPSPISYGRAQSPAARDDAR